MITISEEKLKELNAFIQEMPTKFGALNLIYPDQVEIVTV
jgi:hypothetical protein